MSQTHFQLSISFAAHKILNQNTEPGISKASVKFAEIAALKGGSNWSVNHLNPAIRRLILQLIWTELNVWKYTTNLPYHHGRPGVAAFPCSPSPVHAPVLQRTVLQAIAARA